jgi:hypothetical protein
LSELKDEIVLEILKKFEKINDTVKSISANQEALNNKILKIEKNNKRKNLVLKGLTESEKNVDDLEMNVLRIINMNLDVKLELTDIDVVYRIGKNTLNPRPILLKLTAERKKAERLQDSKIERLQNFLLKMISPKVSYANSLKPESNKEQPSDFLPRMAHATQNLLQTATHL